MAWSLKVEASLVDVHGRFDTVFVKDAREQMSLFRSRGYGGESSPILFFAARQPLFRSTAPQLSREAALGAEDVPSRRGAETCDWNLVMVAY